MTSTYAYCVASERRSSSAGLVAVLAPVGTAPASGGLPSPPGPRRLRLGGDGPRREGADARLPACSPPRGRLRAAASGSEWRRASPPRALRPLTAIRREATFTWTPTADLRSGEHRITFTAPRAGPADASSRGRSWSGSPRRPPSGRTPRSSLPEARPPQRQGAGDLPLGLCAPGDGRQEPGPHPAARSRPEVGLPHPGEPSERPADARSALPSRTVSTWVEVRLVGLPNRKGWVTRARLPPSPRIHTRLSPSTTRMRATLFDRGRPVFKKGSESDSPAAHYPRQSSTSARSSPAYYAPTYGPRAFGLNARSPVLTDWPGGGFIGFHGTNQPAGVSRARSLHGCVRMRNACRRSCRLFRLNAHSARRGRLVSPASDSSKPDRPARSLHLPRWDGATRPRPTPALDLVRGGRPRPPPADPRARAGSEQSPRACGRRSRASEARGWSLLSHVELLLHHREAGEVGTVTGAGAHSPAQRVAGGSLSSRRRPHSGLEAMLRLFTEQEKNPARVRRAPTPFRDALGTVRAAQRRGGARPARALLPAELLWLSGSPAGPHELRRVWSGRAARGLLAAGRRRRRRTPRALVCSLTGPGDWGGV